MEVGAEFSYAGPQASRPTSAKTLPPMAITDRRLKLLNLPEENVSDLRAARLRRNARDCQHKYLSKNS